MRYQVKDFGCHEHSEENALFALVDAFAAEMKAKLRTKLRRDGYTGWDAPEWQKAQIRDAMMNHVPKGDPVDVANFAAFLWNRQ